MTKISDLCSTLDKTRGHVPTAILYELDCYKAIKAYIRHYRRAMRRGKK